LFAASTTGADDYLVKPFAISELIARTKAFVAFVPAVRLE